MKQSSYKIILWGLGREYHSHVNTIKLWEEQKQIEVIAVTAKDMPAVSFFDGWRAIRCEKVKEEIFDYIVVCNMANENEIINYAVGYGGIARNKLIPVRVLNIPYFNWERYIQLKESKLSIISCNCWGGLLYHRLGMECLSPFKNLCVGAGNILRMASDLKSYMDEALLFKGWAVDPNSKQRYPVMYCKDVEIHFNHDTEIEEAVSKWIRRKAKLNYNNILVMIYTEEKGIVEEFRHFKKYRKICFIPDEINEWDDTDIWGMDLMFGQNKLWESVNDSAQNGRALDIFELLAGEKKYRYVK